MNNSQSHQPGANLLPVIRQYRLVLATMVIATVACRVQQPINAAEKAPFVPILVLVDDSTISAPSLAITESRIRGDGLPRDLTLDDVQRIVMPDDDDFPSTKAAARVALRGNSDIWASTITIADDKAHVQWLGGQPLAVPVDLLRAIRLDPETASPEFEKSLATPSAEQDRLFIKGDDDQISVVSGLVDSLTAEVCKLEVSGQIRSLPRNKIYGAIFAQPAANNKESQCIVTFRDRSRLSGENLTLSNGKATLSLGPDITAQFDSSNVSGVAIRSSRLAYLSDWPTINEEQTPIVTLPFPAQRDKSVAGGRLQVGPQFFDKGLGVHARSAITFAIEGKWDTFVAKIGLDDEADGQGDCIFQVLADGKSIFEHRLTGHDTVPADIKLPITGCQRLTLLVEPGAGLDLADHANWCEARLIKVKH